MSGAASEGHVERILSQNNLNLMSYNTNLEGGSLEFQRLSSNAFPPCPTHPKQEQLWWKFVNLCQILITQQCNSLLKCERPVQIPVVGWDRFWAVSHFWKNVIASCLISHQRSLSNNQSELVLNPFPGLILKTAYSFYLQMQVQPFWTFKNHNYSPDFWIIQSQSNFQWINHSLTRIHPGTIESIVQNWCSSELLHRH